MATASTSDAATAREQATFHDVLVRSGDRHATELHLDADEARAAGVKDRRYGDHHALAYAGTSQTAAHHGARRRPPRPHRAARARRSRILTPSARDRATALGILDR